MKCPFCGSENTKVIDSRENESKTVIRRRRLCLNCNRRFTTYERFEIIVLKKDGREEMFDKQKIIKGLEKAFEKRPVSKDTIIKIANEIENEIMKKGLSMIKSKEIGKMILNKIKNIDKVAYVRFASVYFEFADLKEFENILKELLNQKT